LADLGALEKIFATETGSEDEMPPEQGVRFAENFEDFFVDGLHLQPRCSAGLKNPVKYC